VRRSNSSLLLVITSDFRTLRRIESGIRELRNFPQNLWECNFNSTEECAIAWRAELCQILSVLDLHTSQLVAAVPTVPQLPQGDSGQGSALEPSRTHEHVRGPLDSGRDSAPALVIVSCCLLRLCHDPR
jgi:hypothetical protein